MIKEREKKRKKIITLNRLVLLTLSPHICPYPFNYNLKNLEEGMGELKRRVFGNNL
jgi:hypothetical protein